MPSFEDLFKSDTSQESQVEGEAPLVEEQRKSNLTSESEAGQAYKEGKISFEEYIKRTDRAAPAGGVESPTATELLEERGHETPQVTVTRTEKESPGSDRYLQLIKNGKEGEARQAWADAHPDQPPGYGYCERVNYQDKVCNDKQAFCSSVLSGPAGPQGQGDNPRSVKACFTQPTRGGEYNKARTPPWEWAKGVPLTPTQKKRLDNFIAPRRMRAGFRGKSFDEITARAVNVSDDEIKRKMREYINKNEHFDPEQFQGYLKYTWVENHPDQVKEMMDDPEYMGEFAGSALTNDSLGSWDKKLETYKAQVMMPGHVGGAAEIFPSNLDPWAAHYHEMGRNPDQVTAWTPDWIVFDRFGQGIDSPRGAGKDELWEIGRKYSILFNSNECQTKTSDKACLTYWQRRKEGSPFGDQSNLLERYQDYQNKVNETYGLSSITIGYTASGATPYTHLSEEECLAGPEYSGPIITVDGKNYTLEGAKKAYEQVEASQGEMGPTNPEWRIKLHDAYIKEMESADFDIKTNLPHLTLGETSEETTQAATGTGAMEFTPEGGAGKVLGVDTTTLMLAGGGALLAYFLFK